MITTFSTEWENISARIEGLRNAGSLHAQFMTSLNSSQYGVGKVMAAQLREVYADTCMMFETYTGSVPSRALEALSKFKLQVGPNISQNYEGDERLFRSTLVQLVALNSEVSFHLKSSQEKLRTTSELAFAHLQRLIVVDPDYRQKWKSAFDGGELQCEKLGAVHLLWHGIWAFKVDGSGARTDIVFNDNITSAYGSLIGGLVLTEWKKSKTSSVEAFERARRQAELYSEGVLAGVELVNYRYCVVVSENDLRKPTDKTLDGVTYRYINIAIDPQTPSVMASRHEISE